jgi:hypothetical protein
MPTKSSPVGVADRSAAFAGTAQRAALSVLSDAVVAASRSAVASVAAQTEAGYLAEAAHDVSALRADQALLSKRGQMQNAARDLVRSLALEALADGFRETGTAESARWGLGFAMTPADQAALAGHPIVDATATEWADELARRLDWRVRAVATRAALNAIKPEAIPQQLQAASVAWANEVARLVADAWHAGRTAARNAMVRLLSA